jgi:hypothetical protein
MRTLMTRAPAPAATIAAVVLTLKVLCPSPPVPTMSTTKSSGCSTSAMTARDLRTWAAVASDSGRLSSRETCRAAKNAPIWVGVTASGVKICSNAIRRLDGEKYSGVFTSLLRSGLNVSGEYVDGSGSTDVGLGMVVVCCSDSESYQKLDMMTWYSEICFYHPI